MGEEEDIIGDAFPGVGEGRAAGCEGCGISFGSGWCRLMVAATREEVGGSALLIGIDDGIVTLFISCLESSVEEMLAVGVGAFIKSSRCLPRSTHNRSTGGDVAGTASRS